MSQIVANNLGNSKNIVPIYAGNVQYVLLFRYATKHMDNLPKFHRKAYLLLGSPKIPLRHTPFQITSHFVRIIDLRYLAQVAYTRGHDFTKKTTSPRRCSSICAQWVLRQRTHRQPAAMLQFSIQIVPPNHIDRERERLVYLSTTFNELLEEEGWCNLIPARVGMSRIGRWH